MLMSSDIPFSLPQFYSTEGQKDPMVHLRFFNPIGSESWHLIEHDPEEHLAYGWDNLGHGHSELGYFSITELEAIELPLGQKIERDLHFKPCRLSQVKSQLSHD